MEPPSPFEAKKRHHSHHSPTSWLGTNLYDSSSASPTSSSSFSPSSLPNIMTQQAVADLLKSQQEETSLSRAGGAIGGPPSSACPSPSSGATLGTTAAATTPQRRGSSLLLGGLAGLRRGLPLTSLLSDDPTAAASSATPASGGAADSEQRVLAALARTTREVRALVEDRPDRDNEFRALQKHVRELGFVTDAAFKHRLPELLRSHKRAAVEAEQSARRNHLLELAAYELEFSSPASSSADSGDEDGAPHEDPPGEATRSTMRSGTSSPRSVVPIVGLLPDDAKVSFLDSSPPLQSERDRPQQGSSLAWPTPLWSARFQQS